jgi:hypothetical protein
VPGPALIPLLTITSSAAVLLQKPMGEILMQQKIYQSARKNLNAAVNFQLRYTIFLK